MEKSITLEVIDRTIKEYLEDEKGISASEITDKDRLRDDLNIRSLDQLAMIVFLENQFDFEFNEDVFDFSTVGDIKRVTAEIILNV